MKTLEFNARAGRWLERLQFLQGMELLLAGLIAFLFAPTIIYAVFKSFYLPWLGPILSILLFRADFTAQGVNARANRQMIKRLVLDDAGRVVEFETMGWWRYQGLVRQVTTENLVISEIDEAALGYRTIRLAATMHFSVLRVQLGEETFYCVENFFDNRPFAEPPYQIIRRTGWQKELLLSTRTLPRL